jgi:plasmid stabilization system protein ParE
VDAGLSLRSVKAGRHRVYYSHDDEEVRIARILHPAMDARRHFS